MSKILRKQVYYLFLKVGRPHAYNLRGGRGRPLALGWRSLSASLWEVSTPYPQKQASQQMKPSNYWYDFLLAWMFSRTSGCPGSRIERRHLQHVVLISLLPRKPSVGLGQGHLSSSPMPDLPNMATARPLPRPPCHSDGTRYSVPQYHKPHPSGRPQFAATNLRPLT